MTRMELDSPILKAIEDLPEDRFVCGTLTNNVLRAIVKHVIRIGGIRHSLETGAGKSTLLLSHLSQDHLAFSLNVEGGVKWIRSCQLLKSENVKLIEGPAQRTLPQFN